MIEIYIDRYYSKIKNLNDDLIERFKYDYKIEITAVETLNNINKFKAFCLSDINSEHGLYSVSEYKNFELSVLTGNVYDIVKVLKQLKIKFKIYKSYKASFNPVYNNHLSLRDNQIDLVQTALKYKRCLIEAPTAFGKTRSIAEFLYQFNKERQRADGRGQKVELSAVCPSSEASSADPSESLDGVNSLVLVPRIELLYQTNKVLAQYLKVEIGIIGDNKFDTKRITVASIDTLFSKIKNDSTKVLNYLSSVKVVVADEAHEYANFKSSLVFKTLLNCEYYLGVSATLCIKNLPLLTGLIGPFIKQYKIEDAIKNKSILEPVIKFKQLKGLANSKKPDFSYSAYNKHYYKYIVNNTKRNQQIAEIAEELINSNQVPFLILVKIVGTTKNNKASHAKNINAELIKKNIYLPILHGQSSNRSEVIEQLNTSSILGAIASSKIIGTGVDIPSIKAIILAAAGSSNKEFIQNVGRALRGEDKNERPLIYDFYDINSFFYSQSEKRYQLAKELYTDVNII